MYPPDHLALDFPSHDPKSSGKTLLVWGGSSSVGCCAIQLAVASGLKVVATCSSGNFELCRSLGASEVFDYKSETIVEDLIEALGRGKCAGVYNGEFSILSPPSPMAAPIFPHRSSATHTDLLPPSNLKRGNHAKDR